MKLRCTLMKLPEGSSAMQSFIGISIVSFGCPSLYIFILLVDSDNKPHEETERLHYHKKGEHGLLVHFKPWQKPKGKFCAQRSTGKIMIITGRTTRQNIRSIYLGMRLMLIE